MSVTNASSPLSEVSDDVPVENSTAPSYEVRLWEEATVLWAVCAFMMMLVVLAVGAKVWWDAKRRVKKRKAEVERAEDMEEYVSSVEMEGEEEEERELSVQESVYSKGKVAKERLQDLPDTPVSPSRAQSPHRPSVDPSTVNIVPPHPPPSTAPTSTADENDVTFGSATLETLDQTTPLTPPVREPSEASLHHIQASHSSQSSTSSEDTWHIIQTRGLSGS
eukprot:TRINITY_DN3743_c0_g3_i1.p1 TRINITY_DN3743_c0_g3~~TRINITY_DN3743_c0_g3_i1.p1  ORF type:complete len:221 (+),score=19.32 TRINITY_DN3743_c0_g3_i1:77-739(+)